MTRRVHILKYGRTGNQMFQYILALFFQHKCIDRAIEISCNDPLFLKDFGVTIDFMETVDVLSQGNVAVIDKHDINVNNYVEHLKRNDNAIVLIKTLSCRMDILADFRNIYQKAIHARLPSLQRHGWDSSHLVIHIRLGDNVAKNTVVHPNYPVVPFSFYRWILKNTQLKPVFIGQLGTDDISNGLRQCFPHAVFCESSGVVHDFYEMMLSKNVLVSVSTFSYLSAFLSDSCESIHVPLYGIYNTEDRPDCCFTVRNDPRYHYYKLPSIRWQATEQQMRDVQVMECSDAMYTQQ